MDAALQRLGFKVDTVIDGTKAQLDAAMKRLSRRADSAEVAAVFYAGHGIQVNGANYIVPIDAKPQREADLKREMVKLDDIIDDMGQAKVKLVFFDACRDNPLARSFSRGGARGMAAPAEVSGTLISFATKHGNTAADGEGKNSPYTQALIAELNNPAGIEIETLLKNVNRKVKAKTKGQQEPWKYGSLDADFYFIFQGPTTVNVQQAPVDPETETWQAAQRANTENAYRIYLDAYPRGRYLAAARIALDGLNKTEPTKPIKPETPAVPAPVTSGHVFRDCADCPEMVVIPAGSFEMGSTAAEQAQAVSAGAKKEWTDRENPRHRVTIRKPFALAKTEVTIDQFRNFVQATGYRTDAEKNAEGKEGCYAWQDGKWDWRGGLYWDNPGFEQKGTQPAACLSWNDATAYVKWLASKTGKPYRLPSEAEWEYAARAGTSTARYWGDNPNEACSYANVTDNTKGPAGHGWSNKHECTDGYFFSSTVGTFKPNAFGLHDMLGNVWEWVGDCWNDSYNGAPSDESVWASGNCSGRVQRGGSWFDIPQGVRAAYRYWGTTGIRNYIIGFRLARTLP